MKYNWLNLKHEFITGNTITIADFLRTKKIPNNSYSRSRATGWTGEKLEYLKTLHQRSRALSIETEAYIRIRQQTIAKNMQSQGLRFLQTCKTEQLTITEARKILTEGMREERLALGIDEKSVGTKQPPLQAQEAPLFEEINQFDGNTIRELLQAVKNEKKRRYETRQDSDNMLT